MEPAANRRDEREPQPVRQQQAPELETPSVVVTRSGRTIKAPVRFSSSMNIMESTFLSSERAFFRNSSLRRAIAVGSVEIPTNKGYIKISKEVNWSDFSIAARKKGLYEAYLSASKAEK